MAEWFKAADSKSVEGSIPFRGFKSYFLRHTMKFRAPLNYGSSQILEALFAIAAETEFSTLYG